MERQMSKFISWKKIVINEFYKLKNKYNCDVQFISNLHANACIIKLEEKYIIFVSNKLDKRILPLSLFKYYC